MKNTVSGSIYKPSFFSKRCYLDEFGKWSLVDALKSTSDR